MSDDCRKAFEKWWNPQNLPEQAPDRLIRLYAEKAWQAAWDTRAESGLAKELVEERDRLVDCLEKAHGLLIGECPELNMSNYDEDQVSQLNEGMLKVFRVIDDELQATGQHDDGWQPIETAPKDGREVLLYRPLANLTNDPIVCIGKSVPYNNHCWDATVPEGCAKENYTDRACYASHWMPLPKSPAAKAEGAV